MHVTDAELAELERLNQEADEGPWSVLGGGGDGLEILGPPEEGHEDAIIFSDASAVPENAALVVAARNALPRLLAELRELREAVASLRLALARDFTPARIEERRAAEGLERMRFDDFAQLWYYLAGAGGAISTRELVAVEVAPELGRAIGRYLVSDNCPVVGWYDLDGRRRLAARGLRQPGIEVVWNARLGTGELIAWLREAPPHVDAIAVDNLRRTLEAMHQVLARLRRELDPVAGDPTEERR